MGFIFYDRMELLGLAGYDNQKSVSLTSDFYERLR